MHHSVTYQHCAIYHTWPWLDATRCAISKGMFTQPPSNKPSLAWNKDVRSLYFYLVRPPG